MIQKLNIKGFNPYRIYLLIVGMESLAFALAWTVNMVYQVTVVGLNPLQLVLVGTALELTIFLFEIPTGLVADVYSRRLSVIFGYFLLGISIVIEGVFPDFGIIILAHIIMGLGYTFISGATQAWITDEIGQEPAAKAFLRGSQLAQIISFIGIFISVALASIHLQLAIVTGGILLVLLSLILIFSMPELGFSRTPSSERESWSDLFNTLREGIQVVRGRQILMFILLIGVVYGAFTEGFDRLSTALILDNFTLPSLGGLNEIVWFGIISAVFTPVTLLATELINRRVDLGNSRAVAQILSVVYVGLIISVLIFAQGQSFFIVLIGLWVTGMLRTMQHPLMSAWINQHVESNVRATVISIASQADAFGQIGGGPVVGYIGTISTVRIAISVSALMLTPLIFVFNRLLRKSRD